MTQESAPVEHKTNRQFLERFFEFQENNTTLSREMQAGLTTFLTMSYILFVNPQVLSDAIDVPNAFVQLMMVTALASAFGSIFMGMVGRYPFALAPGMGLNAFFAYTVVGEMGIAWQTALGAVFISGFLLLLISLFGIRQKIVEAIPHSLKMAITGGIGGFLALIGFQSASIVVPNEGTMIGFGQLSNPTVWLALVGLIIAAALTAKRVKGAILLSILATSLLAIVLQLPVFSGENGQLVAFTGFTGSFMGIFAAPIWPADLFGQLDIAGALGLGVLGVVFTFFFVDFFDATGTLTGLAQRTGHMKEGEELPRARHLYASDGASAMFGAFAGTSTTTVYLESASGIEDGGKTGLVAVVVGVLFLLAMFLWPLAAAIPAAATAPVLILVGVFMMSTLKNIDWEDITEGLPAFLALLLMPLTYSITNGVSFGVISYCALKLATGKGKTISPVLYIIAVLLIARYIFLPE